MLSNQFKRLVSRQSPVSPFKRYQSSLLPNFQGVNGNTTLGELFTRVYSGYRYRLIWPIVGWAGLCYYFLWTPYTPESEKKKVMDRVRLLQSLEYVDKD
ncbi:hypothetical protein BC833DRAFT_616364 [Globomyces pollinis-pini]|nr:hypothetical protein BC833DRAFT_616364 [Globomyces pollinis-pini]KAJ2999882.1 hypothetical protein HDV02_001401 [Globomyces sp. JEL0801]